VSSAAPTLRLLADDLTGALDTAAEFVGLVGPVHAFWQGAEPPSLPTNVPSTILRVFSDWDYWVQAFGRRLTFLRSNDAQ
jgi:hypothetical protein